MSTPRVHLVVVIILLDVIFVLSESFVSKIELIVKTKFKQFFDTSLLNNVGLLDNAEYYNCVRRTRY